MEMTAFKTIEKVDAREIRRKLGLVLGDVTKINLLVLLGISENGRAGEGGNHL